MLKQYLPKGVTKVVSSFDLFDLPKAAISIKLAKYLSQLIKRLNATEKTQDDIKKQFPKVFSRLGTLGDPYEIQLKEGASPYAVYSQNVLILL